MCACVHACNGLLTLHNGDAVRACVVLCVCVCGVCVCVCVCLRVCIA